GQIQPTANTTSRVPMPPETTEKTGPKYWATNPDSKPPSSLEVPMKRLFTAETRPRFSSGVSNCTRVWRTTTLTLSTKPQIKSMAKESQNHLDKPKPIVPSPKMATAHKRVRPAFSKGGRWASKRAHKREPQGKADWSKPKLPGPARKMSLANTGSSAAAPPSRTAKRSRVMVPRMIRLAKTNSKPAMRFGRVIFS